jgi:NifU-like protein involved in Fe-S cluster formation
MPVLEAAFSQEAQRRLRKPRRRGMFEPIDAARAQLGLLSVADSRGQLRIYWLIDLDQQRIDDARFLAFGELSSHPVADAFSDLVRGRSVEEACHLSLDTIEQSLRDQPEQPAFGEAGLAPLQMLTEIQQLALAALPRVKLLPKPVEVQRYERKRQQDWDEQDRAWLPLSLLKKLAKVQKSLQHVVHERLKRPEIEWEVEGLHDDFQLRIALSGVVAEQKPTILQFFQSELRADIHPQITVEEVPDER